MKKKIDKRYWMLAGVLVLALVGWKVYATMTAEPGQYDVLAKCIKGSGAKFYGADWCPHCQSQKELFGKSKKYLPYVECSVPGSQAVSYVCKNAKVEAFPTWIFADGTKVEGTQTLEELASKTACQL